MEGSFPVAAQALESGPPGRILALARLTRLPHVYDGDMFRRYPGMKLGHLPDVAFFAEKLCNLVAGMLGEDAGHDAWVLTAPAYYRLPSAANLLAEHLQAMLRDRGVALPLVDLRLSFEQIAVHSIEDFRRSYDYSRNPLAQRVIERQRLHGSASSDPGWLRCRRKRVIVVNDIHVTGTQQRFMQGALAAVDASECLWLYIFHIDGELARSHPEIEYRINNCALADPDDYAALLSDPATRHTARCLSRLFNEELDSFRYLVAAVRPEARARIWRLAKDEGRYDAPLFDEKMRLLGGNG